MPHKENEAKQLSEEIQKNEKFSIKLGAGFDFYPFSNEKGLTTVINQILEDKPAPSNKLRVALLFGESHILSMLHALSRYVDVVILADIEPKIHQHTQHMLKCMRASDTIEEYKKNYQTDNPIQSVNFHNMVLHSDQIADQHFIFNKSQVGDHYFLTSQEVFSDNKKGLNQLDIIHINLNLGDAEQCAKLANLIKLNGEIALCNFSNIHDYFSNPKNKDVLTKSISVLLADFPQSKVMYANGFNDGEPGEYLKCNLVKQEEYFKNILKQQKVLASEARLFSPSENKDTQYQSGNDKKKYQI